MRHTFNLKKAHDDYYLNSGDTVYTRGEKPKSEYVSPYKENYYLPKHDITKKMCYSKLGQLEDIEEELGIDLVTLFKALRSGVHFIDDGYPYNDKVDLIFSNGRPCGFKGKVSDHCVFFKDYGKAWSLTKEELAYYEKNN